MIYSLHIYYFTYTLFKESVLHVIYLSILKHIAIGSHFLL